MLAKRARKRLKKKLKLQERHNLEIRDNLAMERTKMANERTFLAYARTAMAMVLAGLTFIKVFEEDPFYIGVGLTFIPVGLVVAVFGYYRFSKKKQEVALHARSYKPTSPALAKVIEEKKEEQDVSP
ncbi:putative membrane protein [Pontibacter ummariensis]|uniref:Putative membrane protein n=1 Tax=Pontibacter ummariensis TaxID=1610492 RepID=A0A239GYX5_9BACT|nr:DUF202 domain-containing protein [Pontibacter ummariensis]PRY10971.1 putative membrane protein [Pontibacter ummariensis]SNS73998.1 putative membrane protein [Pontibacter ummariensis]